jgi:hypothetical protein
VGDSQVGPDRLQQRPDREELRPEGEGRDEEGDEGTTVDARSRAGTATASSRVATCERYPARPSAA